MHEGFAIELYLVTDNLMFRVGQRDSANARTAIDIRIERYENGLVDFVLWMKNDEGELEYLFYSYSGEYRICWGVRDYDSNIDTFKGHSMEDAWTQQEDSL